MVTLPVQINDIISRYLACLNKNNIKVQKAFLFGSYAKGSQTEWSDIDLAIVSDSFSNSRFENKRIIRSITLEISSILEVLPYNPDDFSEEDPFVKEIIETGIPIL